MIFLSKNVLKKYIALQYYGEVLLKRLYCIYFTLISPFSADDVFIIPVLRRIIKSCSIEEEQLSLPQINTFTTTVGQNRK